MNVFEEQGQGEGSCSPRKDCKESSDATEGQEGTRSPKEYFELFNKMPLKALVPMCEMVKPGGVIFTDENIHLLPLGCNMFPYDDGKSMLSVELEQLKLDTGIQNVKTSLELFATETLKKEVAINKCAVCKQEASSKCQNCKCVAYCSREHQLAHWKDHRPFCVLHEVVNDPTEGSYVIAKTNIKKGEAILIEEPYFVTPFSTDEHFNMLSFKPVSDENQGIKVGTCTVEEYETDVCKFPLVCPGCSIYICHSISTCDCGWPICDPKCCELTKHRDWECAYFKENKIFYEHCRKMAVLCPRIIGIVRALLIKKHDPQKWNVLFDDTCEKLWAENLEIDMSSRINTEYLLTVLRNVFRFDNLTYSELNMVLAVIEFKGTYGCMFEQNGDICRRIISVYHTSSLIRHRCIGNVITILTTPGTLHVIAGKAIKKGEILYRNHDIQGDLQHVLHRQQFAMFKIRKPCDCPLCVDLTTGESSLSSIICLKCKRRGYENFMMVETPTTLNSSWKCQKCGSKKSNQQVRTLLQDITRDLEFVEGDVNTKTYVDSLRFCISKYKGPVLHREHSIILNAEFDLIFYMMNRLSSLDSDETFYLIQLLKTRISQLKLFISDAHSNIVSMKMRLATAMVHQAYNISGHPAASREILKTFEDLQFIHDDIAQSFVEMTRTNALQDYLLMCLRKMRTLIAEVGHVFNDERRRLMLFNAAMKHNSDYKAIDNFAPASASYENSRTDEAMEGGSRENK